MQSFDNKLLEIPSFKCFEYEKWSGLLEQKVGITVPKERETFLQTKVWSRMRELGIESFNDYWETINNGVTGEIEWTELLDRLTVHETSFFRHKPSYELISNDFESFLKTNKKESYKVWSLSCSTGEESYSLSMLLQDKIEKEQKDKTYFGITATDISKPALSLANKCEYSIDQINQIDEKYHKYLLKNENLFSIEQKIRERVAFGVFNLLKLKEMPVVKYDIIFCQNVLIYFTKEKKNKILEGLRSFLKIGGILVLSPTDVPYWRNEKMERIIFKGTLAYKLIR